MKSRRPEAWPSAALERLLAARGSRAITCLGDLTSESRERNSRLRFDASRVMGVDKVRGIVPMRESKIGEDLSKYKLLKPGWFAYNPMRINIGSIARWDGDYDVVVSGDYVVFQTIEEKLDSRYLDHLRHSDEWSTFITRAGSGSVRIRIYYEDLSRMILNLPPIDEQRRIADLLTYLGDEIRALRRLHDCFRGVFVGSSTPDEDNVVPS